jgi:hypothetical protein
MVKCCVLFDVRIEFLNDKSGEAALWGYLDVFIFE